MNRGIKVSLIVVFGVGILGITRSLFKSNTVTITGNQITSDRGLEGQSLTFDELETIKHHGTISTKSPAIIKAIQSSLFWHQYFPTTGLRLIEPFYPPAYPFIPHNFSLWDLAPHQGKGIIVTVIDTGVAAFSLHDSGYRKNFDLGAPAPHESLNLINFHGIDPIEGLIALMKPFIDEQKFSYQYLKEHVPDWIMTYVKNHDTNAIRLYLIDNGKNTISQHKTLTQEGQKLLTAITTGSHGIAPGGRSAFTIKSLDDHESVVIEFLPIARITSQNTTFVAGHGTHTFGLIAAQYQGNKPSKSLFEDKGVVGLAPQATTIMIKAFDDKGISDKETLIAALKKALALNVDVVNLSLKIANSLDLKQPSSQQLAQVIGKIPYVVAASGNDGNPEKVNYAGKIEAYPARFTTVPFDIGAFEYKDGMCIIPLFSQYEPGIGPKFVAPGFDIISSGLVPNQKVDSMYLFMAGTSMAAPIMTGFIALMLGEFKSLFTREQLLKVCYASTIKMHDNQEWKTKTLLGILDMRTALFILHALATVKTEFMEHGIMFDWDKNFDHMLQAISYLVFAMPQEYANEHFKGIQFRNNFMDYYHAANQRKELFNAPIFTQLPDALQFVTNSVRSALSNNTVSLQPQASSSIIDHMKTIFKQPTATLFNDLGPAIQKRLAAALGVSP